MSTVEKDKVKEFYSNDVVYKFDKNKRITFGVVIDSYEASGDEDHSLQKGQIRVLWSNSSREQVWSQSKVRLVNRSIIPGDIVRRLVKGKETQRGYCKETKPIATVQVVGTDKVIEYVAGDRLHCVRPFQIDDAVCLYNQFGKIDNIEQMITMQSKCGSVVEILISINHDLDDYWLSKRNKISYDTYYPGQEVICVPANFEQPHWIKKSKSMKRNMQTRQRFTVQSVEDYVIEVAWYQNSAYHQVTELSPEDIKQLKVVEPVSDNYLELSDRKLLKIGAGDVFLKKKDWVKKLSVMYRPEVPKVRHIVYANTKNTNRMPKIRSNPAVYPCVESGEPEEDWWTEEDEISDDNGSSSTRSPSVSRHNRKHYPPKPKELVPGSTLPVEIICVESKVTVVWQDGTEEKDIPSTQLYYSLSLDDHEFFPGEWVVANENKEEVGKFGVIQSFNYLERTTLVKWFSYPETEKTPIPLETTEVSVYDLKKHSKFVFRPDNIVQKIDNGKMGKVIDSCVEGWVRVQWLDKSEHNYWPREIEVIPDSTDLDMSNDESSDDDLDESWETESIESYAGDITDESALQNMASRLDLVRSGIVYMKEAFKNHNNLENFTYLKDLLLVYDNSSYLDKLLGTSFFSLKSKHFQALLHHAKEKAKSLGIELRGRLFSNEGITPSISKNNIKFAEKENIGKILKLEHKIYTEIVKKEPPKETLAVNTPPTLTIDNPDASASISQENLCVELLSMLKIRMDLAYAEIISRIGGTQALSVLTRASETVATPCTSTPLRSVPTTPDDSFSYSTTFRPEFEQSLSTESIENEPFRILDEAPSTHHYFLSKFEPNDMQKFMKAIIKEIKLLKESLPPGVWVKTFGNRADLLSVMIQGPAKTPYEDGLFLFDIQLSTDYPRSPPLVHYISYSSERLNPNLYVEGKVCVSLLGTWMGRGTEVWGPNSTLLQLIVSIQGLILVSEPYYNEAGYEKQADTQQGYENSRTYNELVVLKMVQSMTELLLTPPEIFKTEIISHFAQNGTKLCQRLEKYCSDTDPLKPEFPLLPVSKGLKLSLTSSLQAFQEVLKKALAQN